MHLCCKVSVTLSMLNSKNPVSLMNAKKTLLGLFRYMQVSAVLFFFIQGRPEAMRDFTQFMNATSLLR